MDFLIDIFSSAGFGSILGVIGGFFQKREERKLVEIKNKHQLAMLKAKTDATVEVAKMGIEEAKVAGSLLVDKIEAKAFEASQKTTSKIAEIMKAFIRPIILSVLMYQTYLILISLEELTGGLSGLESSEVIGLYKIVVLSITALTSTAVAWYFASRSSKQFDKMLEYTDNRGVRNNNG